MRRRCTESLVFGARLASLLAGLASLLAGLAPLLSGCGHPLSGPPRVSQRRPSGSPRRPRPQPRQPTPPCGNGKLVRNHFRNPLKRCNIFGTGPETGDEAAVRSGCEQLHDTNIIGLQQHLPTPTRG